jgi:hypothetical protein
MSLGLGHTHLTTLITPSSSSMAMWTWVTSATP